MESKNRETNLKRHLDWVIISQLFTGCQNRQQQYPLFDGLRQFYSAPYLTNCSGYFFLFITDRDNYLLSAGSWWQSYHISGKAGSPVAPPPPAVSSDSVLQTSNCLVNVPLYILRRVSVIDSVHHLSLRLSLTVTFSRTCHVELFCRFVTRVIHNSFTLSLLARNSPALNTNPSQRRLHSSLDSASRNRRVAMFSALGDGQWGGAPLLASRGAGSKCKAIIPEMK